MDKLSSILPTSARVASVDMDDAPPARPGSPAMGRREGRNSVNDRITLSARAKELAAQETLQGRNPKETAKAKIVSDMTNNFFNTRLKNKEKIAPVSEVAVERTVAAAEEMPVTDESAAYSEPAIRPSASRLSIEA